MVTAGVHTRSAASSATRLRHGLIEAAWFSGAAPTIDVLPLGAAAVVCIKGDASHGEVISQAHGGGAFDAVGIVIAGSLRLAQGAAMVQAQSGEAILWNSRHSGVFYASEGLQLLQVLLPSGDLGGRWPTLVCGDQPRRPATPDWAVQTASVCLQTLWNRRDRWAAHELADAVAAVLDLLSRSKPAPQLSKAASLEQLVAQIDAALHDPALGPAWLARRLGVSVRTLYAVTERFQTTVGQLIQRRRLERCRAHLSCAGPQSRIADIAARYGFPDPARFSRAFKSEFGVQPREFRRQQSRGGCCDPKY